MIIPANLTQEQTMEMLKEATAELNKKFNKKFTIREAIQEAYTPTLGLSSIHSAVAKLSLRLDDFSHLE